MISIEIMHLQIEPRFQNHSENRQMNEQNKLFFYVYIYSIYSVKKKKKDKEIRREAFLYIYTLIKYSKLKSQN